MEPESLHKKKKIDYEALQSSLMRIPKMDIAVTRALIDLGIKKFMNSKVVTRIFYTKKPAKKIVK